MFKRLIPSPIAGHKSSNQMRIFCWICWTFVPPKSDELLLKFASPCVAEIEHFLKIRGGFFMKTFYGRLDFDGKNWICGLFYAIGTYMYYEVIVAILEEAWIIIFLESDWKKDWILWRKQISEPWLTFSFRIVKSFKLVWGRGGKLLEIVQDKF